MALMASWDSADKQAVLIELDTAWTFKDFQDVIERAHELIRSVTHPVDIIMWHKVALPSRDLMGLFRDSFKKQPENTGRIIIIPHQWSGMTAFLSRLAELFERLYPKKSKLLVAKTIDEARSLIRQVTSQAN